MQILHREYYNVFSGGEVKVQPVIPPAHISGRIYDKNAIYDELLHSYFGISNFHGYMPTKLYANFLLKISQTFQCPVKHFQEDLAFNMQIIFLAKRIAVMPDVVYYYRMGGGTSRFMPTFFEDCVSLYNFKVEQINNRQLPESFRYTTAIELKNELWSWLEMYYIEYRKELTM